MKSNANTNTGMENPMNAKKLITVSGHLPFVIPAVMPNGTPKNKASKNARKHNSMVAGKITAI
ncbi:MAG: hypothetical protein HamCj_08650 [Candidatus Hamiltonella defensa (Ceratovacuna japonica)]